MSRAQLKAALELDGNGERLLDDEEVEQMRVEEMPAVKKGCICTNSHEPDENGFVFSSPSCLIHGPKWHDPPRRLSTVDSRTVGIIHNPRHGR